jgi:RimJ/RimL family protein N-acetyltransferase
MALPAPDPPLADDVVRLRLWTAPDVPALVAAWADEEIQRWTRVPPVRDEAAALRWITAERLRRDRGLALDLVIAPAEPGDSRVLGEVGMVPLAGGPSPAELGWWVAPEHRRQGVATRAVRLFAGWLRTHAGFEDLVADVDAGNPASIRVAESAKLTVRQANGARQGLEHR